MMARILVMILAALLLAAVPVSAEVKKGAIDLQSYYVRTKGSLRFTSAKPILINGKPFLGFFKKKNHPPGKMEVTISVTFSQTKRGLPLLRPFGVGVVTVVANLKANVSYTTVTSISKDERMISAWIIEDATKKRVSTVGATSTEDCYYGPYSNCGIGQ